MDQKYYMSEKRINYLTNYKNVKIKKNNDIASTIKGGGNSGGNHSDMDLIYNFQNPGIRRLTPVECERLQGFPDGYTKGVSDTQRYKTLGNAVTVNVVTALINKMFGGTEYDRSR